LYASSNIITEIKSKRMRLLEHVERMGTMGNGYKIVVGKPEARRPFGRRGHGWEDNIRMDLREVEW
jgi:hypothetical protein